MPEYQRQHTGTKIGSANESDEADATASICVMHRGFSELNKRLVCSATRGSHQV